jgi:hypothetical protein
MEGDLGLDLFYGILPLWLDVKEPQGNCASLFAQIPPLHLQDLKLWHNQQPQEDALEMATVPNVRLTGSACIAAADLLLQVVFFALSTQFLYVHFFHRLGCAKLVLALHVSDRSLNLL